MKAMISFSIILLLAVLYMPLERSYAEEGGAPLWCRPGVTLGQSADSVEADWGRPDSIERLEPDETGLQREAWVYTTKPFGILSGHAYVCKTQKLIFTGGSVTDIISGEEPIPGK